MPRKPGDTSYARVARHRRVQRLLADGYSDVEISRMLGVSDETVRRDKRAIEADNASALRGMSGEVFGMELWRRYVRRRKELAGMRAEHTEDPEIKLAILREEREEDAKFLAMMQSLGQIYREPLEVKLEQRMVRTVASLTEEELAKLDAMSDRQFLDWLKREGLAGEFAGVPVSRQLTAGLGGEVVE